jgi:hypothetical protein
MSLIVDIDPHGAPRRSFVELRERLLTVGRKFTEEELHQLPYEELPLAAIANAGAAACTLEEVVEAKHHRRYRFLHMNDTEFEEAACYLHCQGMYEATVAARRRSTYLKWASLPPITQLWCTLNCLYTHIDCPTERIKACVLLISRCVHGGWLTQEQADIHDMALEQLRWADPSSYANGNFRILLGTLAEQTLTRMSLDDKTLFEHAGVIDYSCTSNCYRFLD